MKHHRWTVSMQHRQGSVELYDYDWRARAWERLDAIVCACRFPEWVWKIPAGRLTRDEDGFLETSVASRVYDLENAIGHKVAEAMDRCRVQTVPVSQEVLLSLAPDWAFFFEDDDAA